MITHYLEKICLAVLESVQPSVPLPRFAEFVGAVPKLDTQSLFEMHETITEVREAGYDENAKVDGAAFREVVSGVRPILRDGDPKDGALQQSLRLRGGKRGCQFGSFDARW